MSAPPESTLANPEQRIADLESQLAACKAERDEALAQQTATAEVLQVINSSPGDLTSVFDAMLEKATRLCEAGFGVLWTYDGECFHAAALRNVPAPYAELLTSAPYQPELEGAHRRILNGESLIHIVDVADTELHRSGDPLRRALVDLGGARSGIAMALRKDETLLGLFVIYRQEVQPFSGKQIALLQNFAAQAVIAIENARLLTETREALERQTAPAEVLQVINSSPGDLAPVFEAILDKALRLCDAAFGWFWTYQGDRFQVTAHRGAPPALVEFLQQPVRGFHAGTGVGRLVHGERVTIHLDMAAEEAYKAGDPLRCAIVDLGGGRSAVTMALRRDERSLDALTVYRQEVRPFTDKQIALLQNFAAQAAIAMENARLITETREALEQQTATAEVLQVINSSPGDLTPVFDAMLEKAMRLCEAAFGVLWTLDGDAYRAAALRGVPPEFAEFVVSHRRRPEPDTALGQLASGESFVHVADIVSRHTTSEIARKLVELGSIRTLLAVPLRKEREVLGAFHIYRQEVRPFTEKQIALLQNFAAQAVIAMENARLLTETREALEQQTATAEVLQVINSSPGNLGPVFDAMLDKALRLCGAAYGALRMWDGEHLTRVAWRAPQGFEDVSPKAVTAAPGSLAERFVRGETVISISDLADDANFQQSVGAQSLVRRGNARTFLGVALRKDDRLLGTLVIYRQEMRPFTDKEIGLLQNFAVQAVIAIENARLITETREALEQQTATAEVLKVINSSPGNLGPVFDAMLERARRLCEPAFGVMLTWDGERFHRVAWRGASPEVIEATREPVIGPPGSPGYRIAHGEDVVSIADLAENEAARHAPAMRTWVRWASTATSASRCVRKRGYSGPL